MRLSERFTAAQGRPIEVDGQLVHMLYALGPVPAPAELRIAMSSSGKRPEGVRLKARGGRVVVNGEALDDIVLWTDSAPGLVTATLQPSSAKRPVTVRIWNVWSDQQGAMQAWIGDAGMLVERNADGTITLRCSDGYDEPSFDDIVVRLALTPR